PPGREGNQNWVEGEIPGKRTTLFLMAGENQRIGFIVGDSRLQDKRDGGCRFNGRALGRRNAPTACTGKKPERGPSPVPAVAHRRKGGWDVISVRCAPPETESKTDLRGQVREMTDERDRLHVSRRGEQAGL